MQSTCRGYGKSKGRRGTSACEAVLARREAALPQLVPAAERWCITSGTRCSSYQLIFSSWVLPFYWGWEAGRKEDYRVQNCKVSPNDKTYYLNVSVLTYLLPNYDVELTMIYSGLCFTLIKLPGCPVKMQMFLPLSLQEKKKKDFTKRIRCTCIIQCALSFSRLISVTLLMFVD